MCSLKLCPIYCRDFDINVALCKDRSEYPVLASEGIRYIEENREECLGKQSKEVNIKTLENHVTQYINSVV